MFRTSLLLALAACVSAEPGVYPFAYGGYASHSLGTGVGIAGYAPAAVPGLLGGYARAGRYVANSAGVVHVAKRDAEAEAEPGYLGHYGYGGYGLGYAGHIGYGGYGLGYGYGGHYYGKREAEAEPGYAYGGYGLGYAGLGYAGHIGYGGYGLGYGRGYYYG